MPAKSVQEIFYGLRNLQRTPDTGTFRLTDKPIKFRKPPESLRARLDLSAQESPGAWDLFTGNLRAQSPRK